MMEFAGVFEFFSQLLPILLLIVFGFVLRLTGFVSPQIVEGLKEIAIQITLPVVIFLSLLELDFKPSYIVLAGAVFCVSILLLCVGTGVGKIIKSQNPYIPALFTGFENGMLGYGVLAVTLGQENIYPIIIMDLGQTFFFALFFSTYMKVKNGGIPSVSAKSILLGFIANPYVWASFLAIIIKGSGFGNWVSGNILAQGVLQSLNQLANLTTPLMCLAIGYGLRIQRETLKSSLRIVGLRLGIMLIVAVLFDTFLIKGLLHLDEIFTIAAYTMFLLPPFFVGALLIQDNATSEKEFAFSCISIHIVVFLLVYSGLLMILNTA